MKKDELITKIAQETGLTKKQAESAMNAFWGAVTEALKNDDKLFLVDYGTFEIKNRPERKTRNPRTGEQITVAASKVPVFKPSSRFKKNF